MGKGYFSPSKASAGSRRHLCLIACEGAGQVVRGVFGQAAPGAAPACRRCDECAGLSQDRETRVGLAGDTARS